MTLQKRRGNVSSSTWKNKIIKGKKQECSIKNKQTAFKRVKKKEEGGGGGGGEEGEGGRGGGGGGSSDNDDDSEQLYDDLDEFAIGYKIKTSVEEHEFI
jgi:hypothetical protein